MTKGIWFRYCTDWSQRQHDDLMGLPSFPKQNEMLPIRHAKSIAPDMQGITGKVTVIAVLVKMTQIKIDQL